MENNKTELDKLYERIAEAWEKIPDDSIIACGENFEFEKKETIIDGFIIYGKNEPLCYLSHITQIRRKGE